MRNSSPILIIDDIENDVIIAKRALKDAKVFNQTIHAANGREALDYLLNDLNKKPVLILLDLKMPKMTGNEFLRERMNHESLMIIPVIVLTAIESLESKSESFKLNIAGYMQKPSEYDDLVNVMKAINQYWSFSEMAHSD